LNLHLLTMRDAEDVGRGSYYFSPKLLASFPYCLMQQASVNSRLSYAEAKMLRVSVPSFYEYKEFEFTAYCSQYFGV
jgi:hypothetical protein